MSNMSITNVCTKLLLQITRTVPAAGGPDMLTWGDVGIHGPGCLQPKLGPPPVSPLGVVPETGRKTTGFHMSFV